MALVIIESQNTGKIRPKNVQIYSKMYRNGKTLSPSNGFTINLPNFEGLRIEIPLVEQSSETGKFPSDGGNTIFFLRFFKKKIEIFYSCDISNGIPNSKVLPNL